MNLPKTLCLGWSLIPRWCVCNFVSQHTSCSRRCRASSSCILRSSSICWKWNFFLSSSCLRFASAASVRCQSINGNLEYIHILVNQARPSRKVREGLADVISMHDQSDLTVKFCDTGAVLRLQIKQAVNNEYKIRPLVNKHPPSPLNL